MSERDEKMFPILHDPVIKAIPWNSLTSHEAQERTNHGQSLERLAHRGGLGIEEAYCILKDMRFPIPCTWEKSAVRIALMRLISPAKKDATNGD